MAIAIAQHFRTVVISADSRQLFREMTIGTAKPTPEEQAQARHYFVDSHSIDTPYDAAQYGRDALALIDNTVPGAQRIGALRWLRPLYQGGTGRIR